MSLVNLPALRTPSTETLTHTALSTVHAVARSRPDVAIVFNPANAVFLPALRACGIRTAIHFDGMDSDRAKWKGLGQRYFRASHWLSCQMGNAIVADSLAIGDYIRTRYGRAPTYIPYGAPLISTGDDRLSELDLQAGEFHLAVSRFEPENNLAMIVDGYGKSASTKPLVVVGSTPHRSHYRARVVGSAVSSARFLDSIWDQDLLDQLYANCASYLHGHSVGGTNPSLLRAMGAAAPIVAFDVAFNREVADGAARYFRNAEDVATAILADEADPSAARERGADGRRWAAERYVWEDVALSYEAMCRRLLDRRWP
jgi:glycosyltransferase involved in cell wall biosynthesis